MSDEKKIEITNVELRAKLLGEVYDALKRSLDSGSLEAVPLMLQLAEALRE